MELGTGLSHVDRLRLALAISEGHEREFNCEPEYLEALLADYDAQRAKIERLRAALKPFAEAWTVFDCWNKPECETYPLRLEHADGGGIDHQCTIGDLKRAAAAYEQKADGQ